MVVAFSGTQASTRAFVSGCVTMGMLLRKSLLALFGEQCRGGVGVELDCVGKPGSRVFCREYKQCRSSLGLVGQLQLEACEYVVFLATVVASRFGLGPSRGLSLTSTTSTSQSRCDEASSFLPGRATAANESPSMR